MAYRIEWSPSARQDLRDLLIYIAEDDPRAARRFIRSIFLTVPRLIDYPESGRIVPEFEDPSIREIIRRPCRIVYRLNAAESLIEIARVWHSARGTPEI
jgi:plasmid stabilization system protein ParE